MSTSKRSGSSPQDQERKSLHGSAGEFPSDARKVTIEGVELTLAHPDVIDMRWIGNERLRDQLVAAWMVVGKHDLPLNPRVIGKPGVGKTTLAYSVARDMGRDVYICQCTMDTRPEDLLITPVVADNGRIAYHASAILTAMLRGAVCILDEANRMSEKSWASLAPLLDQRRYVESIVTGLKIKADPDFRLCCTMNDDASTYEVPEYIQSRLQPQIEVAFPNREEEEDQQVRTSFQLIPGDPASFVFFTDNAARGRTLGLEAELRWAAHETLDVYANIGLLDAEFEEFVTPQVDLGGRAQAHAPDYTLAAGASYRHPSGVFARLDVTARDAFYFDVSHDQRSQPYELVNGRVGYAAENWSVQLWVRNLFDRYHAVRGFYFGNEPPDFPDKLYTRAGDPRQLGVTFDMSF